MDEVLVESNTNISIGCPGITRNTFVVQLEWRCTGSCGSNSAKAKKKSGSKGRQGGSSKGKEHGLLKYVKDQGTTVFKNKKRLRLDMDMFSLEFDPVTAEDSGKYKCLINNRPMPDAIIDLNVLGKQGKISI